MMFWTGGIGTAYPRRRLKSWPKYAASSRQLGRRQRRQRFIGTLQCRARQGNVDTQKQTAAMTSESKQSSTLARAGKAGGL